MFKKGPDIDKKKLQLKAFDLKKDSLTRLKHFKTLIEHLEYNELPLLFRSHFSFIYHTFMDTFSYFDCNSKQRREDLDCILFMLEKILIFNPELVKKRWQFYSITFVMQKLLHQNNTWPLRQEGVRLFVLWYQILCDETNPELQNIFASLVPNLVPQPAIQSPHATTPQQQFPGATSPDQLQVPIKLCSIDPLMPITANEQVPNDEISFYLDSLLQFMITQTTKPCWNSSDESRKNQDLGFSFMFNMFKKIYLPHLFPDFNSSNIATSISSKSHFSNHSVHQYVNEPYDDGHTNGSLSSKSNSSPSRRSSRRDPIQPGARPSSLLNPLSDPGNLNNDHEIQISLSVYQAIVIRWLTRIMRQDLIPGQDELIKSSAGSAERQSMPRDPSSGHLHEFSNVSEGHSTTIFHNIESNSREMEVARRVAGTWPENIAVIHELFRRAFLNFYQPASMKRVVNVYKEWICSGGPNLSTSPARNQRIGYTSFGDLLQVFVFNSSNAFLTKVHNPSMLEEQVEMCKRIMNVYRYMVMKIYMNTATWEQLLNVMLSITQRLFTTIPPEKKENTIGGRIAPAFFQTFIVSWIRANLYVHISNQMWSRFHLAMKNLVLWRELVEEWSTTMASLTRVLVKHVYGLSLTDLPLDKPQDRRRRPRAMKSFSTAEAMTNRQAAQQQSTVMTESGSSGQANARHRRPGSLRFIRASSKGLTRSCSDGILHQDRSNLYHTSFTSERDQVSRQLRKIKSEHLVIDNDLGNIDGCRTGSPCHHDVMDATSLKDSNMIIENDHAMDSHSSNKSADASKGQKKSDSTSNSDKCVLLGGTVRGWTHENSVIMWRRMLGLFGNINQIADPENHLVAMRCLAVILCDFIKTRENMGISLDNQSTPDQPGMIPPYTYSISWLLEATHLPGPYKESFLTAYKLLCLMSIRRHDIELPPQYYAAFYEALHRGLTSADSSVHCSIIKNSPQLLSLELPGSTFLVQDLVDKSKSILLSNVKDMPLESTPRDPAVQILSSILSLHRPIRKLMVLKTEVGNSMSLVTSGDIRSKVFDTLMQCNMRPVVLDSPTRCKSMSALALHVYQELSDKYDNLDVEKLFDILLTDLQDFHNTSNLFRVNCDLLRLFADHAAAMSQSRPALVSSVIQIICQIIVRMSTVASYKDSVNCLLMCLEDWCIAVGQNYLLKPVGQLCADEDDETLSKSLSESLITIVLRSLENVIHDEQYIDESSNRGTRGSIGTSKGSDAHSSGRHSQGAPSSDHSGPRDRTMTNENQKNPSESEESAESKSLKAIKLACKVSHSKLLTYLGHFPFRQVGAASLSCCVNELDYLSSEQELTENNNSSNVVILSINETTIVSLIGGTSTTGMQSDPMHFVVRNLCGRYSWDITSMDHEYNHQPEAQDRNFIALDPESFQVEELSRSSMKYDSDFNDDGNSSSSLSSRSSTNRDCIGDLLNQLTSLMSHGSLNSSGQNMYKIKRNVAQSVSNPKYKIGAAEETMIALLTNQRFQELNYCDKSDDLDKVVLKFGQRKSIPEDDHAEPSMTFESCRKLAQQLGFLSWEKRSKVETLTKSPRLLRELKNLDSQSGRETHKIAVLYVANGQEDKYSILSNSSGSRIFEDFVSGLGWEVNLESHLGFKGGLQSNKSTGETSPYFCNATTEVMFHVSTRIPLNGPADDESLNRKLRHLGNDEIHIVWSEHSRDYRRGIIPTEFGDVIIAIYPMLTFQNYYRIQILCKQDVPLFGPLFDNCIVHQTSLASLVRATAINASRAKRLKLPYYQSCFEERTRLIETIVQNHKEKQSFEDFAMQFYKTRANQVTKPVQQVRNEPTTPTCCLVDKT